jgi:hypothetical protein
MVTSINNGRVFPYMPGMKCVSCGIGFFSATGSDKCSKCAGKGQHEAAESHGHDSCGCGHSH